MHFLSAIPMLVMMLYVVKFLQVEENVKKAQKEKRMCFDNNLKVWLLCCTFEKTHLLITKCDNLSIQAKRGYEQKCREHDSCEETLKKSASHQSKDEEKVIACSCMINFFYFLNCQNKLLNNTMYIIIIKEIREELFSFSVRFVKDY